LAIKYTAATADTLFTEHPTHQRNQQSRGFPLLCTWRAGTWKLI